MVIYSIFIFARRSILKAHFLIFHHQMLIKSCQLCISSFLFFVLKFWTKILLRNFKINQVPKKRRHLMKARLWYQKNIFVGRLSTNPAMELAARTFPLCSPNLPLYEACSGWWTCLADLQLAKKMPSLSKSLLISFLIYRSQKVSARSISLMGCQPISFRKSRSNYFFSLSKSKDFWIKKVFIRQRVLLYQLLN